MIDKKVFRPKARLISTIGSEIIKDNYAAIIELVKNSYDADATEVIISFKIQDEKLVIDFRDNGIGMSKDTIFNKWLVPATDDKLKNQVSKKGRKVQGRKGIGRFSVGVLGDYLEMTTVQNGKKFNLNINWNEFNKNKYLDEIVIPIEETNTNEKNGTRFIIFPSEDQQREWNNDTIGELIKELNKTVTPLKDINDFNIILKIDNAVSLKFNGEITIRPYPILNLYNYSAQGKVIEQTITYTYENKYENIKEDIKIFLPKEIKNICGKIEFEFRAFDRDPKEIKNLSKNEQIRNLDGSKMNDTEIRKMLNEICGVFVYRNDFRIRPYGDVDFDWLNLDKERVQNPSMKLGANQLFGVIKIEDEEKSNLFDKSARDGLKQNDAYISFKQIILQIIKEIENKRYSYRKLTGKGRQVKTADNYVIIDKISKLASHKDISENVTNILKDENISDNALVKIEETFNQYEKQSQKLEKDIQTEIALYQGQATLGKIMDIIMHEVKKPLSWFINNADNIMIYYNQYIESCDEKWIAKILDSAETSADESKDIVNLFKRLDPLATKSRKTCQNINIHNLIDDVVTIFQNKLKEESININVSCDPTITYYGWKSDLMMCLTNLVENSVYWLSTSDSEREINIKVQIKNANIIIDIMDNGPGIPVDYIISESIFDPGFSGKTIGGSGLGLPIAGEAIERNEGSLKAIECSDGAHFIIELPILRG